MSKIPVILIFDVGKTNKKLLLFDQQYKVLLEESIQLGETADEDGYPCENLKVLSDWLLKAYRQWINSDVYEVKAVNFSAYGASLVLMDENKQPCLPLYNYLKPFPADLQQLLYQSYGGGGQFALETASPELGSLNAGLQLYRLSKQRAAEFQKVKHALHLPQFLGFLLSNQLCTDITSIGCHTALWNFNTNNYHDWVAKEGIAEKLLPMYSSDSCAISKQSNIPIGIGLHDSSAALIPYLKTITDPFVLVSTGTWCISLNPFNQQPLTASELKQDCLFYFSYQGKPVKASRLFAGHEHDLQVKRLMEFFYVDGNCHPFIKYNGAIVEKLRLNSHALNEDYNPHQFIFSSRNLESFKDFEEAYHQLMLDIAEMQVKSIELIIQHTSISNIYVDGGFSTNHIYMQLLANHFSSYKVFAATVPQASAMGAAVAIHDHWNQLSLPSDLIGCIQISPI